MTYVVGDATHLCTIPLSGTPEQGDVLKYNGQHFEFADSLRRSESELVKHRQNIQLLFLQQSITENIVRGNTVDGFFDTFQDQSGIDAGNSTATYDVGEFYKAPDEPSGPSTSQPNADSQTNRLDTKGLVSRWYQDAGGLGHFEASEAGFNAADVTSESGGTKTGFPSTAHGLTTGMKVRFYGFTATAFNAIHTVDAATTTDKVVIAVSYEAETMSGSCKRRRVLTLGSGQECPLIEIGQLIDFGSGITRNILTIDETTKGAGVSKVKLNTSSASSDIQAIYACGMYAGSVSPHRGRGAVVDVWTDVSPTSNPAARYSPGTIYDPVNHQILMFAGRISSTATNVNELWKYDIATNTFTQLSPSGTPPSIRYTPNSVYDPVNHCMLTYGGVVASGYVNDLFKYDIAGNTWTQLSPTGGPPNSTSYLDSAYDPVGHALWIFGGQHVIGGAKLNDLWKYDIAANTWTLLSPAGTPPSARTRVMMVYDVAHALLVFGGQDVSVYLNDLWKYDITADSWTQISPAGTLPHIRGDSCRAFDHINGDYIIFGGTSSDLARMDDLWKYNVATNTWSEVSLSNKPGVRSHAGTAWDAKNGKFYMIHGYNNSGAISDCWKYDVFDFRTPLALIPTATTDATQVDSANALHISGVAVTQTTPGSSTIYHAVSFDARTTWSIFKSSAWYEIARLYSGTWQYKDSDAAWQSASSNTMMQALAQAFAVSANQQTKAQLEAITQSQWETTGGFAVTQTTLDFAWAMQSDAGNIPTFTKYTVTWTTGLNLISTAQAVAVAPDRVMASVLLKNKDASTKVYVSTAVVPSWNELTGLAQVAVLAGSVIQYATDLVDVTGADQVRVRVVSDSGLATEVHGWAVNWD
ncbi:MAG: hypothetical protein NTW27_06040 [Deltaproteobacteria bacterium]|nr:hypothetical protein [Deltaproteobacteria bacterium]